MMISWRQIVGRIAEQNSLSHPAAQASISQVPPSLSVGGILGGLSQPLIKNCEPYHQASFLPAHLCYIEPQSTESHLHSLKADQVKERQKITKKIDEIKQSGWDKLPREILFLILKYLPIHESFKFGQINQLTHFIWRKQIIWRCWSPFFKDQQEISTFFQNQYQRSKNPWLKKLDNLLYQLLNQQKYDRSWVKGHVPTVVKLFQKQLKTIEDRLEAMAKANLFSQEQLNKLKDNGENHHKGLVISNRIIDELGRGVEPNLDVLVRVRRSCIKQAVTDVNDAEQREKMLASHLSYNLIGQNGLTPLADEISRLANGYHEVHQKEQALAKIKEWLKHGADPNLTDAGEGTLLHIAALNLDGNQSAYMVAVIKLLLEHRANPNLTNQYGTALHCAASQLSDQGGEQTVEAMKLLLECGINPNLTNQWGQTALSILLKKLLTTGAEQAVEAIELLLRCDANPNLANAEGETLLFTAVAAFIATGARPAVVAVELLRKYGAKLRLSEKFWLLTSPLPWYVSLEFIWPHWLECVIQKEKYCNQMLHRLGFK